MAGEASSNLTRRERQIMDIVFALGQASVNQIHDRLPDPPAHTAIRTHLRILEDKGHLVRSKRGREFLYRPRIDRRRAGQSALRRVIGTFFGGSLEEALAAHLANQDVELTGEEVKRLTKIVREARERGESS